ncbi:Com family DNA-binding transcriptional regulator [Edwardsiella piscicida]
MIRDIRCCRCNRLLAKASYDYIQVKCPRCKAFNELRVDNPIQSTTECPTERDSGDQSQNFKNYYSSQND